MNRLPRNTSLDLGIRLGFWVVWDEPGLIGEDPRSHSMREILLGPKRRREEDGWEHLLGMGVVGSQELFEEPPSYCFQIAAASFYIPNSSA